jgi:hypothetical protein
MDTEDFIFKYLNRPLTKMEARALRVLMGLLDEAISRARERRYELFEMIRDGERELESQRIAEFVEVWES